MLRLGIAGTGAMAEYQVGKFRRLSSCEVLACVDRNPGNAESFAVRFGLERHFCSIIDLLDSGVCTALSCAASDRQHARLSLAALERGIPVFCEKPLARTLAESEELARKATSAGLTNLVNFSKRNAPALAALKAVLDSGELGPVLAVEAEYLQSWVLSRVWGDWRTVPRWRWRLLPEESSAGVVGDLASHIVDALLYLFGDLTPKAGSSSINLAQALSEAEPGTALPDEYIGGVGPVCVDVCADALLPGAVPVSLRASWIEQGALDEFRIRVRGSKGNALLDLNRSRTSVELQRFDSPMPLVVAGPAVVSTYQRFVELAEAPRTAGGLENRHGLPDFAQGLAVQRILDTIAPGGLPV
jgi:predicted dehydrogenase